MSWTRRDVLALGSLALAGAALGPSRVAAQTPKRGGTLSIRGWDPPLFDPMLTTAYRVHVPLSLTHSRLVRHRAGPSVPPGTFPIEGDLAESWTQPNETTYVFKLRRGVRWHPKPPVNGRELTSADVKYSVERFLTVKGNPSAYMLRAIDRVETPDAYTVRIVLKEVNAWFLEMLANPMSMAIVAREAVEKFGDLKKAESVIGTGPVDAGQPPPERRPHVRAASAVLPGRPAATSTASRWSSTRTMPRACPRSSPASTISAGTSRAPSGAPTGCRSRTGSCSGGPACARPSSCRTSRPTSRCAPIRSRGATSACARPCRWPSTARASSTRRRRASASSIPPSPPRSRTGRVPIAELGEGARYFKYDPAEAKRLLAAAGYPNGFPASLCFTSYGSTTFVDTVQLLLKYLKDVGITTTLDQREYGAFIASCYFGKFDSLTYGPQTPFVDPDNYVYGMHYPEELKNQSHVNDPVVTDLLVRQRRTVDPARRREILAELQRHLARQQYYVQLASPVIIAVWDGALKNYGPNLGYDYGGRLVAAWLDR